jgi:UV DNA damage endonuclease
VENDDARFGAADCLHIHRETGIPVLFDVFHHACHNGGEPLEEILEAAGKTWKGSDGTMMVDYSSQHPGKRPGGHADHLDPGDFRRFLRISRPHDMDIMLEIKDKEAGALAAIAIAGEDPRFVGR